MPIRTDIIAVDWGTTNRRAYAIGSDGAVKEEMSDGRGVLAVERGGFPPAVAEIRSRLGPAPMVMAGMVGSNRGWVEVPYRACPAGLAALAGGVRRIPDHDAVIIPGLSYSDDHSADVMRGEEVQLLGAVAAGLVSPDVAACHPGTHAKWVRMQRGEIVAFRTVMTGELFALLKKHSILSNQLQAEIAPSAAFVAGVRRSLESCELTADLFQIRARGLAGTLSDDDAGAYASGLLIGADIRTGTAFVASEGPVALIGDPALTSFYGVALRAAGRDSLEVDGETAFLAGIRVLAEHLL